MSVPSISPALEIAAKSYSEQIQTAPSKSLVGEAFRQNFLNVVFTSKQNLLASGSYSHLNFNGPTSEKYKEYKKLFQPVEAEKATPDTKADAEKITAADIDEYSGKLAKEIELATMNQLVFSVSTRFGSAINQMVRGQ